MNHTMRKILFLIPLLAGSLCFFGQDDEEKGPAKLCSDAIDKKALSLYEKGRDKKKYKKPERLEFLMKALEIEPDFAEANLAVALEIIVRIKLENGSFTPAIPFLLKAIASCPQIHSEPYYYIGYDYYEQGKNDSAVKYLKKFVAFKDEDDKKFARDYEGEMANAKGMLKQVNKDNSLKKGVLFDPKVVRGVSTERDEYLAYISPDDKSCYYVRRVPVQSKDKVYASDKEKEMFMVSARDKTGVFDAGEPMIHPFNASDDNQGGCTISIDNKHLYFAMMKDEGGNQPNCDIYVSDEQNGEWSPIRKLSPNVNHPVYWDSQPTIAADGLTLYFASDRPGGYGGIDIYVTHKDPRSGIWGIPKNLGPNVNTAMDEKTPFMHSDSETLYFSSNGHSGFGGYDIFYARKNEKGEWAEPENIGSPINGPTDDTGFFVSTDTKSGYFFSFDDPKVRGKGVGRYDLYMFELYKEARPQEVAMIKGDVKDNEGNQVFRAEVEIKNTRTKEITHAVIDSSNGSYMAMVNLKKKDDYVITVKKDDYAFSSKVLKTKDLSFSAPPKQVDLEVIEAKEGKSFVIDDIFYNTNSAELKAESRIIIEGFAGYLKLNPKIKVEIQGHTDNVGNPKDNEALSNNRAFSVKALLEELGVEGKRITAKGFGPSKPIADNKTEEGRARNRRTEFMILEK
jgi:outer membrane protein OmpA-like peptidoglycan-associated protein